ncbi:MAG: beta-N-acetylhexosaminidase [Bacteroidetes bacterium]|nr:beta-N-acetylhexosaminidase [Bacteroidota bacterium]MBS1539049.1 beta-N-acetylhexosaminidase [Bacteroidota bacterium]
MHLTGEGYLLWKHLIYHRVYGLQEKPSLIPLPQQLQWKAGRFPLYQLTSIVIENSALQKEAERLQQSLSVRNISVGINKNISGLNILLKLGKVEAPNQTEEAYSLSITEKEIVVTANSPHGVSNGIRTLLQLMRDSTMIDTCEITDWPAFAWRGYMVDVGRNFQPVGLLKQQIEVMAKYKLNVFHLHLTEDIAWRLEVKRYPQLTAPESMLRNKGMYYAEADIKELIAYCKERHITFVPEIDMPGHSAAFTRAMKTSMQSDSGIAIVKNILKEICSTYDVPYIHIGADEVRITNRNFVPEVTAYIESLGKKVIGWQPGGNFTNNTIRQLWMDDKAHLSANGNIQFIDSRHLYLNHLDPLEAVTTIFNRKIGNKEEGDKTLLGGTICLWNDRAAANENDILRMNPVYPSMLAFAERAWQGGGQAGWIANIDDGDKKAFVNFENRLLDNKLQYFYNKPFAYVRQSNSQWKLYGPYNNGGDVTKAFEPEREQWKESSTKMVKQVTGATIVLRHWWAPLIKGALDNPTENTTWYATTTIWSEEEATKDFWIGFNNISRSPATDSPPQNGWDHKGSAVWVNGKLISPPAWKRPGQKGNADIPLIDEGYEYRTPTKIQLQKGFNTVVLKIPVGSFKGKDWQNPVKWMFTFVEVN